MSFRTLFSLLAVNIIAYGLVVSDGGSINWKDYLIPFIAGAVSTLSIITGDDYL